MPKCAPSLLAVFLAALAMSATMPTPAPVPAVLPLLITVSAACPITSATVDPRCLA